MSEIKIEDLLKGEVVEKTKIIKMEIKTAEEVYKGKTRNPNKKVLVVYTENGTREAFILPEGLEFENGEFVVVNKVKVAQSLKNRNSKLGNFIRKYGKRPEVGMEVETTLDDKTGFSRIVI